MLKQKLINLCTWRKTLRLGMGVGDYMGSVGGLNK